MRIAFITYTFPPQIGGMQNWNHQMAEAYSLAGHMVCVYHLVRGISKHHSKHYTYKPVYIDKKADQSSVPAQYYSIPFFLKTLLFLFKNFNKLKSYDVWQITVGEPQLLRIALTALAYFCNVKVIAASGNVIFRSRYNPFTRPLKYGLAKFVLHRANAILVDGIDIKKECEEQGVKAEKIRICYAGVDTAQFTPLKNDKLFKQYISKNKKPFSEGKKSVLYSCRFSWENAPDVFLEAVKDIDNIQVVMVGNGPMMDSLRKQALLVKSPVHFWGALPYADLPLVFSNITVCLYTYSRYIGGISQVIPLSMACGAVVITTDIGDNKALIQNKTNGFLVEEKDTSGMRRILEEVLSEKIDINSIKRNARATIVNHWSMKRRNEEYAEFLRKSGLF